MLVGDTHFVVSGNGSHAPVSSSLYLNRRSTLKLVICLLRICNNFFMCSICFLSVCLDGANLASSILSIISITSDLFKTGSIFRFYISNIPKTRCYIVWHLCFKLTITNKNNNRMHLSFDRFNKDCSVFICL